MAIVPPPPDLVDKARDLKESFNGDQGPWFDQKGQPPKDRMFSPLRIDGARWDKLFPYRLVVWDAEKQKIVGSGSTKVEPDKNGSYRIEFEPIGTAWVFKLPITPQQFSVSTVFTSAATATQRGIVEEHGGIKFKMISCSGSFGVWPNRKSLNPTPSSPGSVATLFSGTIESANNLANQFNRTIRTAKSEHPSAKPQSARPLGSDFESTGYYQMLLLDQFLEQYSEFKKKPEAKHWRLVLDIPKENQSFIVTPVQFAYSKSADSPNEVKFSLQLKAWRRINLNEKFEPVSFSKLNLTPNLIGTLINTVQQARRTISTAYDLIRAVRSDFKVVFDVLRDISLFAKEIAGIPAALVDLPVQIISDAKSSWLEVIANRSSAKSMLSLPYLKDNFKKGIDSVRDASRSQEGVSRDAVVSGQLGAGKKLSLTTSPVDSLFDIPEKDPAFEILNSLTVDEVSFSNAQQDKINADLDRVRDLKVDDLIQMRNELLNLAIQISNAFGSGDSEYSKIYRRPAPYSRIQSMTIDEFDILNKLYDLIQALDSVTATNELDENRIESAFEYVGSLASISEIPFEDSQSKVRLPVPFGLNMEQIAARYLGDPDRWIEIATLNGLRSPYIDEDGFFYDLLSNADGRQFNIATNANLYVGQKIVLSSLTQPQTTRRITNIEKISSSNFLITVDGLSNLDVYTTTDNAKLRAYLPGTVNSQDQIYVPSNLEETDTFLSRPVPATKGDPLVGLSKIDWLLTESGDIATDAYADFRLSFGITNLIQALKIKFITPPNRLLKHPDYGAGLTPGTSHADLNDTDVIRQIISSINNDPRYGDIINLFIEKKGPTYSISLSVTLANGSGVFPISFVLNS